MALAVLVCLVIRLLLIAMESFLWAIWVSFGIMDINHFFSFFNFESSSREKAILKHLNVLESRENKNQERLR